MVMSTFSPIDLQSSKGKRIYVCVCVYRMNLKYALHWHIHIDQFIPYTRILKPFEDSEPTGLKVDIAMGFLLLLFVLFCAFGDYPSSCVDLSAF